MSRLARKQLAQTRRDLERDAKNRDRSKLAKLRDDIKEAQRARTERVRGVRAVCRAEREGLRERARIAREALRDSITRMREQAKNLCAVKLDDARAETGAAIADAVKLLGEEQAYQHTLKVWAKPSGAKAAPGRAREKQRESDDEVANNIEDPGLRAVWDKVKRSIKPTGRMTRTEAFLHWAHDNPADVERYQYEAEEKAIRELIKQEAKMRKAMERPDRYRRMSDAQLAEHLADVPF
jgi:hypothetical protein